MFQPRPLREEEREWLDPFLEATGRRGTRAVVEGATVRLVLD